MHNIQKLADEIFKAPTSDEVLERWAENKNLIKNPDGSYYHRDDPQKTPMAIKRHDSIYSAYFVEKT